MKELILKVSTTQSIRIDKYLSEVERIATRNQVQRLIKKGLILVGGNAVKPSHQLKGGEIVKITIPDAEPSHLLPEPIPLDIVYEDQFLLVVNKPPGMVVHPGSGVKDGTLVNALLSHCKDLSGIGGVLRPGIVHRLDKGTSGLLLVAKDDMTHLRLSQELQARTIKRTYHAIVWGVPRKPHGTIQTLIGRSLSDRKKMSVRQREGRQAITSYRVLEEFTFASLVEVELKTGRTHQIRVHLAHIGHPVFGDPTYGGRRRKYGKLSRKAMERARQILAMIDRQALHAVSLEFVHPVTQKKVRLEAPLPQDMEAVLQELRKEKREGGGK